MNTSTQQQSGNEMTPSDQARFDSDMMRQDAEHEVFVVQPKWQWWKEFLDDDTNGHEKGEFIRDLELGKSLDEVIDDFYMAHLEANR